MRAFQFFETVDYNAGLFVNSRVDNTNNISDYHEVAIIPDVVTSTSQTVLFDSISPGRTWNISGGDLVTNISNEYITFNVSGYAIDIVYDNSLTGSFAKQYVNTVNLENVSTYGAPGTQTIYRIPLNGNYSQTITLINTGSSPKNSVTLIGPTAGVGVSLPPATSIRQNSNSLIADTWTFKVLSATQFSIKQTGNGVTTNYATGVLNKNAIPGLDIFVVGNNLVVNDTAVLITSPAQLRLHSYILYPSLGTLGSWTTPVMDSQDPYTQWTYVRHETAYNSISSYMNQFSVGDTPTPDSTWNTFSPQTVSFIDHPNRNYKNQFRSVVASSGFMTGQYAQATFNMSAYTDFIRGVEITGWNPSTETMTKLLGPIVKGPTMNQVMGVFATLFNRWRTKIIRLLKSKAVSSAQREYLFSYGRQFNTPIHLNETLSQYQQRLTLIGQGRTKAGTFSYMQNVLQQYCNTNAVYIRELLRTNANWQLGISKLGVNTYLGNKEANVWEYEIHIPGALSGVSPDDLVAFINYLNPIGGIPILIWE